MKQIKIFKTNNKEIMKVQDKINDWVERERIDVISINTANGAEYKSSKFSNFDEKEIFIIVLYVKN